MLTTLSGREVHALMAIVGQLNAAEDGFALRHRLGELLLDLFHAQHFASYVWNPRTHRFDNRVGLNMNPANLARYEAYYQFNDPITHKLQQRVRATAVNEVMAQDRLMRTEFFNDFLARDGLHFGMNFYAYDGPRNIGDLRIWRGRGRENFDRRDLDLLDVVGRAFTTALRRLQRTDRDAGTMERSRGEPDWHRLGLTLRERDVAALLLDGASDAEIASRLGIAVTTVRTHVGQVLAKSGSRSRAAFIAQAKKRH